MRTLTLLLTALALVALPDAAAAQDTFPAPDWSEPSTRQRFSRRRMSTSRLNRLKLQLNAGTPAARRSAIRQLGGLGYQARHVVDPLATLVRSDPDLGVRAEACETLGKIGGMAYGAVPTLCEALKHTETRIRTYAAWALFRIRRRASKVVPALLEALKTEPKAVVRSALLRGLGAYRFQAKDAVPRISACLNDPTPSVRSAACNALGWIGDPAKPAIPTLKGIFKNAQDPARLEAATALGRLGEVGLLMPALDDPNLQAAVSAGLSQHAVGRYAVRLVTHAFSSTRAQAARSLGAQGAKAAVAVPALVRALEKDTSRQVQVAAAKALGAIGPAAATEQAVDALINVLRFQRKSLKVAAADALANLGPGLRRLGKKKADEAARFLGEGLDRPDEAQQLVASRALAGLGPNAAAALPRLIDGLQWGNDQVRRSCAKALAAVGAKATPAVPTLIEALKLDASPTVRAEAAAALGAIGNTARAALPALLKAAGSDDDPVVARQARTAAQRIQGN